MKNHSSNLYDVYNSRRLHLIKLAEQQLYIVTKLKLDNIHKEGISPGSSVKAIIERLETDNLRVLVIGKFNAGKSTFINSMLHKNILPMKIVPATAVICEVRYASEQEKKILLYPKPGLLPHGDAPFEVPFENLDKYLCINHNDKEKIPNPYNKMELLWPIGICKNGVQIVDSPGLDDPDSHDKITLEYLPKADAVLYLMSAENACSKSDMTNINLIRGFGISSPFFIITYFDRIVEAAMTNGSEEDKECKTLIYKALNSLTEIGETGISFLDSKSALIGRLINDESKINASGIKELEQKLEEYLVKEKGNGKLQNIINQLRLVNDDLSKRIPFRIATSKIGIDELEKRCKEAQIPLEQLELKRKLLVSKIDRYINDICRDAGDLALTYFSQLPDKISLWSNDYTIENEVGIILNESKIEIVVKEVSNHLKKKMEEDAGAWFQETLSPFIEKSIDEMINDIENEANEFLDSIDRLRLQISISSQIDIDNNKSESFQLSSLQLFAFKLANTLEGPNSFKSLFLTLFSSFFIGFLGIPMLAVAGIIATIASFAGMSILSVKDKIKTHVTNNIIKDIINNKKKYSDNIESEVMKKLNQIKNSFDSGLSNQIYGLKDEISNMLEENKKDQFNAEKNILLWESLLKENEGINTHLKEIEIAISMGC
jgi:GTP-binding protein EngB required for normal cell division